jgi:hypothetical protein
MELYLLYSTPRKDTKRKQKLVEVAEGKKKCLRPKSRREYNIKFFLKEIKLEGVDRNQIIAD